MPEDPELVMGIEWEDQEQQLDEYDLVFLIYNPPSDQGPQQLE